MDSSLRWGFRCNEFVTRKHRKFLTLCDLLSIAKQRNHRKHLKSSFFTLGKALPQEPGKLRIKSFGWAKTSQETTAQIS